MAQRDDRDPDRYETVDDGPEIELRIKGSRFLGRMLRVSRAEEAGERLQDVRRRFHDATHNCSAWRVGDPEEPAERHDDDGEPSGTAGLPILQAIQRADVTDALCVVTRYFGGTKLGTGGLVRAYGDAAREALEAAPRRTVWREAVLRLEFAYDDLGIVETVLGKSADALRDVDRAFEPAPRFTLRVKRSRAGDLADTLTEATAGRARITRE